MTQRREQQHESNIEGASLRLEWKHEVKEARAAKERAGMQRIWNDPSQTTKPKELRCAKAAKRLKTRMNPDMYSLSKKHNKQSSKKQECTEYMLTRSNSPSQRARQERERTKQKVLH